MAKRKQRQSPYTAQTTRMPMRMPIPKNAKVRQHGMVQVVDLGKPKTRAGTRRRKR